LPKKTAPDEVKGSKEFIANYNTLKRDSEEYKRINECITSLKQDCQIGDKIGKEKIPPHYLKKYGVTNLYRVAIGNSRLTYTIIADKNKKVLCILEYFPTHKEYNERFGYDT
jgi:mRNA-degrading endonuclease RelE of RelBE toxin-antitoxin system